MGHCFLELGAGPLTWYLYLGRFIAPSEVRRLLHLPHPAKHRYLVSDGVHRRMRPSTDAETRTPIALFQSGALQVVGHRVWPSAGALVQQNARHVGAERVPCLESPAGAWATERGADGRVPACPRFIRLLPGSPGITCKRTRYVGLELTRPGACGVSAAFALVDSGKFDDLSEPGQQTAVFFINEYVISAACACLFWWAPCRFPRARFWKNLPRLLNNILTQTPGYKSISSA